MEAHAHGGDVATSERAPPACVSASHSLKRARCGFEPVVGDVVWAKTRGFPFWPAKVVPPARCREMYTFMVEGGWYLVRYFGSDDYAYVCDLQPWKPFYGTAVSAAVKDLKKSKMDSFDAAVRAALMEERGKGVAAAPAPRVDLSPEPQAASAGMRLRRPVHHFADDMLRSAPPVDDRFKMVVAFFMGLRGLNFGSVKLTYTVRSDGSETLVLVHNAYVWCKHMADPRESASWTKDDETRSSPKALDHVLVPVESVRKLTSCDVPGTTGDVVRVVFDPQPADAADLLYSYTFHAGWRRRTTGSQAGQIRWFNWITMCAPQGSTLRIGTTPGTERLLQNDHTIKVFLKHAFRRDDSGAATQDRALVAASSADERTMDKSDEGDEGDPGDEPISEVEVEVVDAADVVVVAGSPPTPAAPGPKDAADGPPPPGAPPTFRQLLDTAVKLLEIHSSAPVSAEHVIREAVKLLGASLVTDGAKNMREMLTRVVSQMQ